MFVLQVGEPDAVFLGGAPHEVSIVRAGNAGEVAAHLDLHILALPSFRREHGATVSPATIAIAVSNFAASSLSEARSAQMSSHS